MPQPHEIHTLDLQFQGHAGAVAAYLVRGPAGVVLVETGPASTLTALEHALGAHGVSPGDLAAALVTHIHLDHAGAAGQLATRGVPIYVHHVGAPHLVDPSRLLRSAERIYGDAMDRLWGTVTPAPAEQVTALADGDVVDAAGLTIEALETPGHAGHHHSYRLGGDVFTGDVAGVRLPDATFVDLPAPPPELDVARWHASLERLAALEASALYPTHFGRVDDPADHLAQLRDVLDAAVALVRDADAAGAARDQIVARYTSWLRARAAAAGVTDAVWARYEAANPHFMTVDGILRWLRSRA